MVWPGLGVNYKSLNRVDEDIRYFRGIGLRYIRIHVPYATVPWDPAPLAHWRNTAKRFHDAGFHVMWGFSSMGPTIITASNWSSYANSVVAEAKYCQDNDICDLFIIGNEMEQFNDNTTLTDAQLRTNIRVLGASVKSVFTGDVIYCVEYGSAGSTFGTYRWIQEGKGSIDYLGANLYGNYNATNNTYFPRYAVGQGGIPALNAAFGSNWMLSEFGVDGTNTVFDTMPEDRKEKELATYLEFIKNNNVNRAYIYQYRAFDDIDANDSFFLRYSNGQSRPSWYTLATNNRRRPINDRLTHPVWSNLQLGQSYVTLGLSNADFIASPTNANLALEDALAASDTVCIYDGVYNFANTARIPANKTIIGQSRDGVILKMNTGVNKTVLTNADALIGITMNVTIQNLTIDQQGALQTAGGGLIVTGIQNWRLTDVLFKKSYRFNFLCLHQATGVPNKMGTITLIKNSNAVVGVSTLFSQELKVGDILKSPSGEFARVQGITDNTNLTLTLPWGYANETNVTYKVIQPNSGCRFTRVRFQGTVYDADASGYGFFDNGIIEDCSATGAAGGGCGFVPDHSRNVTMNRLVSYGHNNSGISLETCEDCTINDPKTYDNPSGNGLQFISGTSRCVVRRGISYGNTNGYSVRYNTTNARLPQNNAFINCLGYLNSGYAFRNDGAMQTEFSGARGYNNDTGGLIVNTLNTSVPDTVNIGSSLFFDNRTIKSQDRGVWIVAGNDCSITNTTALNSQHTIAGIVNNGTNTTMSGNST